MRVTPYESRRYLGEYLLFHYGQPRDLCPFHFAPAEAFHFHRRIVEQCLPPLRFAQPTRGLDIGCAVGRLTFELAGVVDYALGVDNSASFIRAARRMGKAHRLNIRIPEHSHQFSTHTVGLPARLRSANVEFKVADAQNLRTLSTGPFHVVAAINLICRLPHPRNFLSQLPALVVPGGYLLIGSPYSWLEVFTPRSRWVSPAKLLEVLRPHFRLVSRRDLPFLIREHRRKYQWVVSEVLTFQRRP